MPTFILVRCGSEDCGRRFQVIQRRSKSAAHKSGGLQRQAPQRWTCKICRARNSVVRIWLESAKAKDCRLACIELSAKQGANREALDAKREEERAAFDRYRRDGDGEPASSGEERGALGGEWADFVNDEDEAQRRREREEWEVIQRKREEEDAAEAEERKQRRQRKRERRSARAQHDDDNCAGGGASGGGGGKRAKTHSASRLPRRARDAARAAPAAQKVRAAPPARSRFARAAAVATAGAAPLASLENDDFDVVGAQCGALPLARAPKELHGVAPSPATKNGPYVAEDGVGGEWADFM